MTDLHGNGEHRWIALGPERVAEIPLFDDPEDQRPTHQCAHCGVLVYSGNTTYAGWIDCYHEQRERAVAGQSGERTIPIVVSS